MNTEKTTIPALGHFVSQGKDYFRIYEIETGDDPDVGEIYFARHNITGEEKCFTDLVYVTTTARKQTPVFSGSELADDGTVIPPVAPLVAKAIVAPVAPVAAPVPMVAKRGPGRPRKNPAPVSVAPILAADLPHDMRLLASQLRTLARKHGLSDLTALASLTASLAIPESKA